ncbi:MAG: hypothetical protein AAF797_03750 [Planctomycetota bacterium]
MSGRCGLLVGLVLLFVVGGVGCRKAADPFAAPVIRPIPTPADRLPGYAELAERYNATLDRMEPVYAQTIVKVAWVQQDDEGNESVRRENGEGKLVVDGPKRTLLTVEKVGKIFAWAGSNEKRFWLFDLSDEGRAMVGERVVQVGAGPVAGRRLPMGLDPAGLPYLLGLARLDMQQGGTVERTRRGYAIRPAGLGMRMELDEDTGRPLLVEVLDTAGRRVAVGEMTWDVTTPVERPGVLRRTWPEMWTYASVWAVEERAVLELKATEAISDRGELRAVWFDFDGLVRALGVKRRNVERLQ